MRTGRAFIVEITINEPKAITRLNIIIGISPRPTASIPSAVMSPFKNMAT